MPDTPPTPGQVCYDAYCAAHGDPGWFSPWGELLYERHAYWEAAAQAVRLAYNAELAQAWAQGEEQRDDH